MTYNLRPKPEFELETTKLPDNCLNTNGSLRQSSRKTSQDRHTSREKSWNNKSRTEPKLERKDKAQKNQAQKNQAREHPTRSRQGLKQNLRDIKTKQDGGPTSTRLNPLFTPNNDNNHKKTIPLGEQNRDYRIELRLRNKTPFVKAVSMPCLIVNKACIIRCLPKMNSRRTKRTN